METGGVGWGYQRPDDHVLDTTLWAYMLAWGCNMSLRWHFVGVGWGGVGWGGDINVLTTTSLILRCEHICSLEDATCHYVDTSLGWGGVGWGGVGWWYQRPDDHVPDTTLSAYMLAWGCNMSLRWHFVGVGWGGVGWWYQRPDDHVPDTTLWAYMLAWGCNMSLRWHFVGVGWGGVGWGGDINVLTTTSLILRCEHICSLEDATCHYVDTSLGWNGVGWGGMGISTSWRPRPWYYVVSVYARLRMQHVTTLTLRWGGVGWGGVGISTSWRPRPWYYVVSIYARLRMQHVTTLTLRWGGVGWGGVGWWYQRPDDHVLDTTLSAYMLAWGCNMSLRWHFVGVGWGGVGWGGDINVLTTTSLILRCQHICSLEDATCHYVDTSLGWGGVGWWYQRPDDHVPDTTLSAYMLAWGCNMSLRWHFVGVEWGGVGWWYQRPDDHVPDTTLWAYMLAWGCNMSLRWHFVGVGWGGVGWWYQPPDDHVLDTTLSAYMLAWGCNMSLYIYIYIYLFIYLVLYTCRASCPFTLLSKWKVWQHPCHVKRTKKNWSVQDDDE